MVKGATIHFIGTEKTIMIDQQAAQQLRTIMENNDTTIMQKVINFNTATIVCRNIAFVEWLK